MSNPVKIFIAYSRLDEEYLKVLRKHLKPLDRNKTIRIWYDGEIAPGSIWEQSIKDNLYAANIILLLVSANSLASDYFYEKEMADALARHEREEAIVIPIILDYCSWKITELNKLQALPKDGKPVSEWESISKAYTNIVEGLNRSVLEVKAKQKATAAEILQKKREAEAERQRKIAAAQEQERLAELQRQTEESQKKEQNIKNAKEKQREAQIAAFKENPKVRYGAMGLGGVLLLFVLMWGMSKMGGSATSTEQINPNTSNAEIPLLAGGGLDSTTQYQNFFNAAQVLFNEKNYDKALIKLDSALVYQPNDTKAQELQNKAKAAQKEQSEAEKQKAQETAYKNLIDKADSKFKKKQWTSAKSDYEGALAIKDDESHPKSQIKKIEAELNKIAQSDAAQKEQERKNQEYNRLVKLADGKYNQQQWKDAKSYYEQAANYKNTQYVKDRIGGIDWKLKQEETVKTEPKTTPPSTGRKPHPEIQKLLDNMVTVQGGTFQMGSNDGDDDEKPVHSVTVSTFQMGKYEVTQAQWKAVMGSNPSSKSAGCNNCPVETVSWNDAQDFIKKLNQLTGKRFRLPTEAEWEFAAIGGTKSRNYKYAGSNSIDEVAWYYNNSGKKTHPVGGKKANELGLYDMSGNVYEWCEDDWHRNYNGAPTNGKAWIDSPRAASRVRRGGSWSNVDYYCRSSDRGNSSPSNRNLSIGLRLAQ